MSVSLPPNVAVIVVTITTGAVSLPFRIAIALAEMAPGVLSWGRHDSFRCMKSDVLLQLK